MCSETVGQVLDGLHSGITALLDDVGRPEAPGQRLAVGVPAHGNDPFRTQLPSGQHTEQTDCAVADDGDGPAWPCLGGHRCEPARAEHVGGCEQRRDQVVVGLLR